MKTETTTQAITTQTNTNTNKITEEVVTDVTNTTNNLLNYVLDLFGISNTLVLHNVWIHALIVCIFVILCANAVRFALTFMSKNVSAKIKINAINIIFNTLKNPIFNSIILFGAIAVISILDVGVSAQLIFNQLIFSIFWVIWWIVSLKISKTLLQHLAQGTTRQNIIKPQTLPVFSNLLVVIISLVFFYLVISTWGLDMTAFIASAGVLGLAVGFAAKDTLSNLFSGVFILADQPYKLGDFVVLDSGERGEITHIGIRSTRMLTRDDIEITVPNAIMGNSKIINESGGPYKKYRIKVKIGVAYGTQVDIVRNILLKIANNLEDVCNDPAPRVRFRSFGASSLDFELLCWVDEPVLRGRVLDILNEQVYNQFIQSKIEIPYQKQDVYIKEIPK